MTHEKNMIDYLDWIEDQGTNPLWLLDKILGQRNFLKSQPKLGDFIPTNKKGEVMEKPKGGPHGQSKSVQLNHYNRVEQYQSALDRVIWKGWEVEQRKGYSTLQKISDKIPMAECYDDSTEWDWYGWESYESLITSGVKLERIEKK